MAKVFVLTLVFVVAAYSVQANDVDSSGETLGKRKRIDPRCRKRYGLFSVPDDCTKYLYCSRGQGKILTCPDGRRFDSRKYCTSGEADCGKFSLTQTQDDFPCPGHIGVFSYPPDCHKYLVCFGRRKELKTCDNNGVYVPYFGCTTSQEECPSIYTSTAVDPCSLPVENGPCNDSLTMYFYNTYSGRCEPFNYTGCKGNANRFETMEVCRRICGDDDEDDSVEVTCPEPYGNYSVPEDCTRYISCFQGLVTFKQCPKGWGFDGYRNICVPAEEVECEEALSRGNMGIHRHAECGGIRDWGRGRKGRV